MKRPFSKHQFVALTATLVWIATIVLMIVHRDNWQGMSYIVMLGSLLTAAFSVGVSRFWIAHRRLPAYGTLFVIPVICAVLLCVGGLVWNAARYDDWYILTLAYWAQAKGGYANLWFPVIVIGTISILPSAAVVAYYRQPGSASSTEA